MELLWTKPRAFAKRSNLGHSAAASKGPSKYNSAIPSRRPSDGTMPRSKHGVVHGQVLIARGSRVGDMAF